ncbi:uncharacterized protein STEHIDRAFT_164838 [Stereum hirsutum FP-91666 SS1]|uniref:uncharacterized protein n=1 Tax=Stereum hirsutum (strain FP-91666) TaxID=721885 RepID=UPI000440E6DD|nr:uncharacterized protein STEHIDRAFT_164838 [Stereum hirsutum FP-91666 SS1]EIM92584.1 hypothetical protein STEHIDRAFT_164838 [Stereum hirsutum FP-91666 SS1]
MVVRIRFAMHGKRNNRILHLVAIHGTKARNAKPIETLAVYNPHVRDGATHKQVDWSVDRIKYWLEIAGAEPSKSAVRLLEKGGIIPPDSKWHPKATGPGSSIPSPPYTMPSPHPTPESSTAAS